MTALFRKHPVEIFRYRFTHLVTFLVSDHLPGGCAAPPAPLPQGTQVMVPYLGTGISNLFNIWHKILEKADRMPKRPFKVVGFRAPLHILLNTKFQELRSATRSDHFFFQFYSC